jgi:hypothetical protein
LFIASGAVVSIPATLENWKGSIIMSGGSLTAGNTDNEAAYTQSGGAAVLGRVTGTGTMTIGGAAATAHATASGLAQTAVIINANGLLTVNGGSGFQNFIDSLSITGNGTLDLTNRHLYVTYLPAQDPIASIAAWIKSGYNGGAWNGPGILSTNAQTDSRYAVGYADADDPGNPASIYYTNTIEIAYTLVGDANLDYKVNGADFAILAANFNKAVTGYSGWDQGDFNYDGKINGADFAALASNFNKGASQSATDLAALDSFAQANNLSLSTSVPEPTFGALALLASGGILSARRRSSQTP